MWMRVVSKQSDWIEVGLFSSCMHKQIVSLLRRGYRSEKRSNIKAVGSRVEKKEAAGDAKTNERGLGDNPCKYVVCK